MFTFAIDQQEILITRTLTLPFLFWENRKKVCYTLHFTERFSRVDKPTNSHFCGTYISLSRSISDHWSGPSTIERLRCIQWYRRCHRCSVHQWSLIEIEFKNTGASEMTFDSMSAKGKQNYRLDLSSSCKLNRWISKISHSFIQKRKQSFFLMQWWCSRSTLNNRFRHADRMMSLSNSWLLFRLAWNCASHVSIDLLRTSNEDHWKRTFSFRTEIVQYDHREHWKNLAFGGMEIWSLDTADFHLIGRDVVFLVELPDCVHTTLSTMETL